LRLLLLLCLRVPLFLRGSMLCCELGGIEVRHLARVDEEQRDDREDEEAQELGGGRAVASIVPVSFVFWRARESFAEEGRGFE